MNRSLKLVARTSITVGALGTLLVCSTPAPATVNAASCTLSVPDRVAVDYPAGSAVLRLGADCAAAGVTQARWNLVNPGGSTVIDTAVFRWESEFTWARADKDGLGIWTWQPAGAIGTDPALTVTQTQTPAPSSPQSVASVPQNQITTDIRLASNVGISRTATEPSTGRYSVYVDAEFYSYAEPDRVYLPWGGGTVQLQSRTKGTTTWTAVHNGTLDANGYLTYPSTAVNKEYRAYIFSSTAIWGGLTTTV